VAASILHLKLVTQRNFFARLNAVTNRLAILQSDRTTLIECKFSVDQIAVVLQQPLNPQGITVEDFLIGLQRNDNVSIRLVALLHVADQVRNKGRRHELVIGRAASIEITVLLDQLERINRPVLASRLNHIEMREQ